MVVLIFVFVKYCYKSFMGLQTWILSFFPNRYEFMYQIDYCFNLFGNSSQGCDGGLQPILQGAALQVQRSKLCYTQVSMWSLL
jgi:hypothetical protein